MNFGVLPAESLAAYHSNFCLSKTRLDCFRENPARYRDIYITRTMERPKPTEAMLIGSATGCFVLEGAQVFASRYAVVPEDAPNRPTKRQINAKKQSPDTVAAIAWWKAFEESSAGREVLSIEQRDLVLALNAAIRRNPLFCELTAQGKPEVTFRMNGERIDVQVRPDWWSDEGCATTDGYPVIVDLKTIAELPADNPEFLGRHIADYGYHRASWLYSEIVANVLGWGPRMPRPRFFLAFVSKEPPHATAVVELGELDVEIGEREVADSVRRLVKCMETGVWEEPQVAPTKVSLPTYYIRRVLDGTDSNIF